MTTTFFLLRHAAHDNVGGYLAGRSAGVSLGPGGLDQARRLGERMRREKFDAIVSSPRERTSETAQAVSKACGVGPIRFHRALDEIDFGTWSGKSFEELNDDAAWRHWNTDRDEAVTPAGEGMGDVQGRIWQCMERLAQEFSGRAVVLVSHADVIKAAICKVLGLPHSGSFSFEIDPASISVMAVGDWGGKLLRLNESV